MDPNLKRAVAVEAAKDPLGRTGGAVARSLTRFRRWDTARVSDKIANLSSSRRVWEYWKALPKIFGEDGPKVLSVVLDGTRMSNKDTFYMVAYSSKDDVAA